MEQQNPFAPPVHSEERYPVRDDSGVDATNGQRFLTMFIDTIVCLLGAALSGAVLGALGAGAVGGGVAGGAFRIVYYIALETFTGRTVGKLAAKTRVVSVSGEPLTAWQVTGRTFARIIPFEPFSFFGQQPGGWHDRLSGTRVIQT
jgi:uncharacterized RDD family membrane protein YckC